MAQFTIYKSSDASAPTVSGTAGDLVNLLDKCLVTGYGAKAAAGWTKPFTGVNKAAFKLGAGTGFYLRVQDDGPGAGGAKEARITGYEAMTTVDAGTNPFPDAAHGIGASNAFFAARKSTTADATTRNWIVVADSRTAYVFIQTGDVANTYYTFAFGDIYTLLTGDLYNCITIGRDGENAPGQDKERLPHLTTVAASIEGECMARGYTGVGGPVSIGTHSDGAKQTGVTVASFAGIIPFPNPEEGGLYLGRVWVHDPTTTPVKNLRGRLRGIWCPMHAVGSFTDGDVVTGSGELAGKTFLMVKDCVDTTGASGVIAIETSNTLETN